MQRDFQAQYKIDELPPAAGIRTMMTLQRDTLDAAFRALTSRYGSFDRFLEDGLQLSARDREALKARFLE
jgi:protein tyrosine/serine phosphatase